MEFWGYIFSCMIAEANQPVPPTLLPHTSTSITRDSSINMGEAISTLRNTITAGDKANKEEMKDQLSFLVNAANSKLDLYQAELDQMFMDSDSVKKRVVPGMRALRWERGYRVSVSKSAADGPLGDIVNAFFGDGTPEDQNKDGKKELSPVLKGFKTLIRNSLNAILGNSQAGEQEEQKFFVFMHNNAIIRIDIKIWRYNFSSQMVMAESENVFCYIFCTSVVDITQLKLDELIYLITERCGDDEDVNAYVEQLLAVFKKVSTLHETISTTKSKMASLDSKIKQLENVVSD